ncbi:hypothetical protein Q8V88_002613 [Enterobacter hormaechei]|nr:hypothetical protein [Enterobacter hormaechei]
MQKTSRFPRVLAPSVLQTPGVPFTEEIHFHLFFDASIAAPVLIAAVSDSANTSAGIIGNRAAQKALVLTQSISPISCAVIASRSSLIRAAFASSFSYRVLFIVVISSSGLFSKSLKEEFLYPLVEVTIIKPTSK